MLGRHLGEHELEGRARLIAGRCHTLDLCLNLMLYSLASSVYLVSLQLLFASLLASLIGPLRGG